MSQTVFLDLLNAALLVLAVGIGFTNAWIGLKIMGQFADKIAALENRVTALKAEVAQAKADATALQAQVVALTATQPDEADKAAAGGVDAFLSA